MPPADEVLGAYRQVGTISGLAEHFNVPAHTIQGWARRLRKEGHDIGRAS
jgi:transposase